MGEAIHLPMDADQHCRTVKREVCKSLKEINLL
jgi:hypothetical protein